MEKEIVINSSGIEIYNLSNIENYDIDFVLELEMFKEQNEFHSKMFNTKDEFQLEMFKLGKTFFYYKRAFLPSPFEDNFGFSIPHLFYKKTIEEFDSPVWVFEEYLPNALNEPAEVAIINFDSDFISKIKKINLYLVRFNSHYLNKDFPISDNKIVILDRDSHKKLFSYVLPKKEYNKKYNKKYNSLKVGTFERKDNSWFFKLKEEFGHEEFLYFL